MKRSDTGGVGTIKNKFGLDLPAVWMEPCELQLNEAGVEEPKEDWSVTKQGWCIKSVGQLPGLTDLLSLLHQNMKLQSQLTLSHADSYGEVITSLTKVTTPSWLQPIELLQSFQKSHQCSWKAFHTWIVVLFITLKCWSSGLTLHASFPGFSFRSV